MISKEDVDVSTAMATLILHNANLERELAFEKRSHSLVKESYEMMKKDMLELRPDYFREKREEFFKDVVAAPSWDWQRMVRTDKDTNAATEAE